MSFVSWSQNVLWRWSRENQSLRDTQCLQAFLFYFCLWGFMFSGYKLLRAFRIPATSIHTFWESKGQGHKKMFSVWITHTNCCRLYGGHHENYQSQTALAFSEKVTSISWDELFPIFPLFFMNLCSHLADLKLILPGQFRLLHKQEHTFKILGNFV